MFGEIKLLPCKKSSRPFNDAYKVFCLKKNLKFIEHLFIGNVKTCISLGKSKRHDLSRKPVNKSVVNANALTSVSIQKVSFIVVSAENKTSSLCTKNMYLCCMVVNVPSSKDIDASMLVIQKQSILGEAGRTFGSHNVTISSLQLVCPRLTDWYKYWN